MMDHEEEVEFITFRSELTPVAQKKQYYGEILSDHVECGHATDQYGSYVLGFWWLVFDEHLNAIMKKWEGEVRVYKTGGDGKRILEHAFKASRSMLLRIVIPKGDSWKATKLDYEIDIRITKHPLETTDYDEMFKKSEENDTAIEIENKIVFVNKQLLIENSDYFRCLFSPEFCDAAKPTIGLSTFDEFCMLLCTFHPPHKQEIQDHQVEELLELAERFQMKSTTDKIRLHLLQNTAIPYNKQLWLAEKHRLPEVINALLTKIRRADRQPWKVLQLYDQLSEETRKRIDERY